MENNTSKNTDFDVSAEFNAEAEPLVRELYALSVKHGVPELYVACPAKTENRNDDDTVTVKNHLMGMAYFNGRDRTPMELVAMFGIAQHGLTKGVGRAVALMAKRVLDGGAGEAVTKLREEAL